MKAFRDQLRRRLEDLSPLLGINKNNNEEPLGVLGVLGWGVLGGASLVMFLQHLSMIQRQTRGVVNPHWMGTLAAGLVMLGHFCVASSQGSSNNNSSDEDSSPSRPPILPPPARSLTSRPAEDALLHEQHASGQQNKHNTESPPTRYLELLVHNVSHTDLVLSLQQQQQQHAKKNVTTEETSTTSDQTASSDPYCLCRPRFSCVDLYTRKVLAALTQKQSAEPASLVWANRYQRALDSPRLSIHQEPSDQPQTAIGFALPTPVASEQWHELRIRGRRDQKDKQLQLQQQVDSNNNYCTREIIHVFLPLLATLLPRWEQQIAQKHYNNASNKPVHRVLVLVTGVGTPRNWTHSVTGNSTQALADLMQVFLERVDPTLTVVKIHSTTNIFRYDENLVFVERELVPALEAYRDAHARGLPYPTELPTDSTLSDPKHHDSQHPFNEDWQKSFAVTLSFADGSQARTHAIQACLRPYRPTYFHFWQLKTFWHEFKIVDDDIEVHSFEAMETIPPVDADRCTDVWITAVVGEMKSFLADMTATLSSNQHDIHRFWLRKTHKPVLAVLLVQTPEMKVPALYRGTNMEVSMPTGSLCAERNVIGSALAENPSLKRQDLKLIAVLAVPLLDDGTILSSNRTGFRRVPSTSTVASLDLADRRSSIGSEHDSSRHGLRKPSIGSEPDVEWVLPTGPDSAETSNDNDNNNNTGTPLRRIDLFSKSAVAVRQASSKRTVVIHSHKDINPLKPCGACNEWLKKIAESNPYFRVVTFTDAQCNGIYVSPCQE